MSKHTPGPWQVGSKSEFGVHNPAQVQTSDGSAIAQVYGISLHVMLSDLRDRDTTGLANARLIAAAPDLLEACKALPNFDIDSPAAADFKDNAEAFMRAMRLARAAIAKAVSP